MTDPKSYKSAEDFRKALEHRLKTHAAKSDLNLQRVRRIVAFNRFLARVFAEKASPWILKGGYAMELRIHNARATQDIDLGFRGVPTTGGENQTDYIQRLLAKSVQIDMGDFFVFQVGGVQMELDGPLYGGARYPVRALVDDRLFVSFHVDAAVGDYVPEEFEAAVENKFLAFAGIKSSLFHIIPREVQFAEKLHAYTMPRSVPNSRVRDLVDMVLLIREGKLALRKTGAALKAVFGRRKSHEIPDVLEPAPVGWKKSFADMAQDCDLKIDIKTGFNILNRFYSKIVQVEQI